MNGPDRSPPDADGTRADPPTDPGSSARDLRAQLSRVRAELGAVRYELSRLESRRLVRLAVILSDALRRPDRGRHLARAIPAVIRGDGPLEDPVPHRSTSHRHPYPHLTVGHLGPAPMFDAIAPHVGLKQESDSGAGPSPPLDLVIIDARAEPASRVPAIERAREHGAPVVLVSHTSLVSGDRRDADLVVRVGPTASGLARSDGEVLELPPSVDVNHANPIGWRREPRGTLLDLRADTDPEVIREHRVSVADSDGFRTGRALIEAVLTSTALGTPVIVKGRSDGREGLLADVAAGIVGADGALRREAEALVADTDRRERVSVLGRREVFSAHTRRHRFEALLDRLDIPRTPPERISVLLATNRPGYVETAVRQVREQAYPDVELVLIAHGEGFDAATMQRIGGAAAPVRILSAPGHWHLGDCLNAGLDAASGTLIAKMDDDDRYGPVHLDDLVAARRYTGADLVGKTSNFAYLESLDRTVSFDAERQERWDPHHLPGFSLLADAALLRRVRFRRVPSAIDTHLLRDCYRAGAEVYSTHRYGLMRVRHGHHTHRESDERFLRRAGDQVWEGLRLDLALL